MDKNLTGKVSNKTQDPLHKLLENSSSATADQKCRIDNKGRGNAGRVNTLMQMYTNIAVTEKKEGGKGCIYNRTTGMVMWVKGLNAGTLPHAHANQFQKILV